MKNIHPLWKNLALFGIAILGLIYSIPNLYTEDPAVQISSATPVDMDQLIQEVTEILDHAKIDYDTINRNNDRIEIIFSSTDAELLAKEVIRNHLGPEYTVALNLAPSTPNWLRVLGAQPMKQGLDLRGGVHFLLEVDIASVTNHRYEGFVKNISQSLREEGLRYAGIRYVPKHGINIFFRAPEMLINSLKVLKVAYPELIFASKIPNTLIGTLSKTELNTIRKNTLEQTMAILRNRVNELGIGEAVVQQQGLTRVAVDLPGIQDAARAKQILGGTATLEFHLVDQDNDASVAKQTGVVPVNSKLYMLNEQPILLKRQIILSGDAITSASSGFDQQTASAS